MNYVLIMYKYSKCGFIENTINELIPDRRRKATNKKCIQIYMSMLLALLDGFVKH